MAVSASLNDLKIASFRGVDFFYQSSNESGGFKIAEHVYPGSDNFSVEQLGAVPRRFDISAQVVLASRDALTAALDTPGQGVFSHPMYGSFNATVTNYTKTDSKSKLGLYSFSINFVVERGIIQPTVTGTSQATVSGFASQTFMDVEATINSDLSKLNALTTIDINRNNVIFGIEDRVDALTTDIQNSVRKIVNEDNAELSEEIGKIDSDIVTLITDAELGTSMGDLFRSLSLVTENANDRTAISISLLGFGSTVTPILNNPELATSQELIDFGSRVFNLSQAYENATQSDFISETELDELLILLDTEYSEVTSNQLLNLETRNSLASTRSSATSFLKDLNLNIIDTIRVNQIPSTVLSYRLYGDSTRSDELVALNGILNTGFINGTIEVLQEQK